MNILFLLLRFCVTSGGRAILLAAEHGGSTSSDEHAAGDLGRAPASFPGSHFGVAAVERRDDFHTAGRQLFGILWRSCWIGSALEGKGDGVIARSGFGGVHASSATDPCFGIDARRGWNPVLGRLPSGRSSWVMEPHGAAVEKQQEEHVLDATMASNQYVGGYFL